MYTFEGMFKKVIDLTKDYDKKHEFVATIIPFMKDRNTLIEFCAIHSGRLHFAAQQLLPNDDSGFIPTEYDEMMTERNFYLEILKTC